MEMILCKKIDEQKKVNRIKLRNFDIFPKESLKMAKLNALRQRIKEDKEMKELEKKNEQMLKEANERQSIFELYLGSRHQGSSFHKDFYVNRIF